MNPAQQELLLQAASYAVSMMLAIGIIAFLMRGFFWTYLRVRSSLGRLVLVKLKAINRDYFCVGRIEQTFLVFKVDKGVRRIALKDKTVFYRCMGVIWIDIDDEKNSPILPDGKHIDGFDANKFESLYLRAMYKPVIMDKKDLIIIILCVLTLITVIAVAYLQYKSGQQMEAIKTVMNQVKDNTITQGGF